MNNKFDDLPAKWVPIESIMVLSEVQPRTQMNKKHVAELVEVLQRKHFSDQLCALKDPDTKELVLVSGFHRIEAYQRHGVAKVKCIIATGTRNDAMLYACTTNTAHGKQRTNGDKRRAVDRILTLKPKWGDRRIARWCDVCHGFVAKRRDLIFGAGNDTSGNDASAVADSFNIDFECRELCDTVRMLAGRCDDREEMQTLVITLHGLLEAMTKRRKRML